MDTNAQFLSIPSVAKIFDVDRRTIVGMIERGELAAVRIGRQWRIKKSVIEQILKSSMPSNAESKNF